MGYLGMSRLALGDFRAAAGPIPQGSIPLTVHVLLVSLEALDDARVGLQAALPQLVQVIHHVIVGLRTHTGTGHPSVQPSRLPDPALPRGVTLNLC